MTIKILAASVAIAMVAAYLCPLVFKMKDLALAIVVLVGVVVMLVDMWHSLRKPEE